MNVNQLNHCNTQPNMYHVKCTPSTDPQMRPVVILDANNKITRYLWITTHVCCSNI